MAKKLSGAAGETAHPRDGKANAAMLVPACALLLSLAAGCLSSAPPPATEWTFDCPAASSLPDVEPKPAFAATRLGNVSVMAPYDRQSFAVRRADGSIAFDPANRFAAQPSALLKWPLLAGLSADGRFGHVVPQTSTVSAEAVVEVTVPELSLDCRTEGERRARAAVTVNVIRNGRSAREIVLSADGAGEADASSGDYSAAFGAAVGAAVSNALSGLK